MRILQIGKYPKEYHGGIEIMLFSLSEYLARDNTVEVVCSTHGKYREEKVSENLIFRYFPIKASIASAPIAPSIFNYLRNARDFDIIQISLPNPFVILAYLLAAPPGKLVLWYHSDIIGRLLGRTLLYPFSRRLFRKAECIVVSSENYKQSSRVLRKFKRKIAIIPYGINPSYFTNQSENKKLLDLNKEYNKPLLLFIGRLVYYKGIGYLVRAMQNVEANLLIIGCGMLESKLRDLVVKLKLNNKVFFLNVPREESLAPYIYSSDLFVLPSIYRSEAFGTVLLEAMACGKPVVTTELGTGTTFVCQDGETGLVVPSRDPVALAAAVNRILGNPEFAKKMGEAGKKRVEELFTIEKMVKSFLGLYKKLLTENKQS